MYRIWGFLYLSAIIVCDLLPSNFHEGVQVWWHAHICDWLNEKWRWQDAEEWFWPVKVDWES